MNLAKYKSNSKKLLLLGMIVFFITYSSKSQTLWSETFESGNSLTLVNDGNNYWIRGTSTAYDGTHSLYITNNGTSNNYTANTSRTSHAYKDVDIPVGATSITLSFYWKCNGETGYDRLLVYAAPIGVNPKSYDPVSPNTTSLTLYGAKLIGGPYNSQTTWQFASINIDPSYGGTKLRIIFTWQNNNLIGNNPAAAIDNITLSYSGVCLTGPMSGNYTIGPTGNFPSLTAASNELRKCGVSAPVNLILQSTYNSSVETFPISFGYINGISSTNRVTIYPSVSGLSITSNNPEGTFNLNGAQYITIDGRVNASGSTKDLIIENTSTTGYTIQLINGTSNCRIQYCRIKGVNTEYPDGIITFSRAGSTGNNDNIISYCDIYDGTTKPLTCISSFGTNVPDKYNINNTISNSNIFNFSKIGSWPCGISIEDGNSRWTIDKNSIYQTSTINTTADGTVWTGIYIVNSGDGYNITNNYIGGSGENCSGTWTVTGNYDNAVWGILMSVGNTTPSEIQGNTITNFNITTKPSIAGNAAFQGIEVDDGSVNIGTSANNIIGSNTSANVITVNYVNPSASVSNFVIGITALNILASDVVNIGNESYGNIISGFSLTGTNTTGRVYMNLIRFGYRNSKATFNIINNQVGNGVENCMYSGPNVIAGIVGIIDQSSEYSGGTVSGSATISQNILGNFTSEYTGSSTNSYIRGIGTLFSFTSSGYKYTITNNTIRDFKIASSNTSAGADAVLIGINLKSQTAGQNISNNIINNLVSTATGNVAVQCNGIVYSGPTTGTNIISRNNIYELKLSSTSTSALINGILINSGLATTSNNFISLGTGVSGDYVITGINQASTTNNIHHYFNSVYIGGSSTGSNNTRAFYSATSTHNVQSNIFYNARTGGTGRHYAIVVASKTGLTSNRNCLLSADTSNLGSVNGGTTPLTFAGWQNAAPASDANSINTNPAFIAPASSPPDLHLNGTSSPCYGIGQTGTGITVDFDNETRKPNPDIGADEIVCPPVPTNQSATSPICIGNNATLTASVPGCAIYWYSDPGGTVLVGVGSSLDVYPTTTTTYYPRAYNGLCFSAVGTGVTVTVNPLPQGSLSGSTICEGETGQFTFTATSGTGPFSLIINGVTYNNISSGTPFNVSPAPGPSVTTNYILTSITDAKGCQRTSGITGNSATITVNKMSANPTSAIATPSMICLGNSATLTLNGGGGGTGEVIKWYTGSCGGTLVGTGNNLSVNPSATTTYYGRYETPAPCNQSTTCQSVTVTVGTTSSAPTSASATVNPVCAGEATDLVLAGGGGGTGATIKWYSSSCGGTLVGSGNNLTVYPNATTTYYGRWEDACGNNTICRSVTVNVNSYTGGIGLVNNDAKIYISSNTTVYIDGDENANYYHQSGCQNIGEIKNYGTISLEGNWYNNSTNNVFTVDDGTVTLNGDYQEIGGTTQTNFYNLNLSGTAGSVKSLRVNTQVGGIVTKKGILSLGKCVLNLGSKKLTISNPLPNAYTRISGYIRIESYPDIDFNNKIQWNIGDNLGEYVFPFGRDDYYPWIPFIFKLNNGDIGNLTVSTYSAKINGPYEDRPRVVNNLNLNGVDNSQNVVKRFWLIEPTGSGEADLTFTYVVEDEAMESGDGEMIAQRYVSGHWEYPGYGSGSNGTVTANGITNFSPWTLAKSTDPLDITLSNFSGFCENSIVTVKWTTLNEKNAQYFTIEKSNDAKNWNLLSNIPAKGNTNSPQSYSITDLNSSEINYYKLKEYNISGNYKEFGPLIVRCSQNTDYYDNISYSYSPEEKELYLFVYNTLDNSEIIINMFDILGRQLINKTENINKGISKLILKSYLTTGIYYLNIEFNGKQYIRKVFIY